ncbi:MAG: hypothetical protein MI742_00285 [Desulfobacterales bacterium]|nr:hypothetical protein [Desulfobacterales bacterium]
MNPIRFSIVSLCSCACVLASVLAHAATPLTNHDLSGITGQATANPSDESRRDTTYPSPTEVDPNTDELQVVLPKAKMVPSNINETNNNTVILDFLPSPEAPDLGIFDSDDFQGFVDVGNIVYTDNDTHTSIVLDGQFTGYFLVPSYFGHTQDGVPITEHTISVNASHIPQDVKARYQAGTSDFLFHYQGTGYSSQDVLKGGPLAPITAYPNRQAQMVGKAPKDKDLDILVPSGHGDNSGWHLLATIPKGESFIKIDMNRLVNHHTAKYTVKIGNNKMGLNAGDPGSSPTDRSGTLGTLYMGGDGKTIVEPGCIIITKI